MHILQHHATTLNLHVHAHMSLLMLCMQFCTAMQAIHWCSPLRTSGILSGHFARLAPAYSSIAHTFAFHYSVSNYKVDGPLEQRRAATQNLFQISILYLQVNPGHYMYITHINESHKLDDGYLRKN